MIITKKTEDLVAEAVRGLATNIAVKAHREDSEGMNPFRTLATTLSKLSGRTQPKNTTRRQEYLLKAADAAGTVRHCTKDVTEPAIKAASAYVTTESTEYAVRYAAAAHEANMAVLLTALEAAAYTYAVLKDLRGQAALRRFEMAPDAEAEKAPAASR